MKAIFLIASGCIFLVSSLTAGTIAVDALSGTGGLAGGITAGYEFEVTNPEGIVVDGLGYWDDQSNGFFVGQTFAVGLWEAGTGTLLTSSVITSASALTPSAHPNGDWRVNPVTPVHLPPGLYRFGGLLPDVGANPVILSGATLQIAPDLTIIRHLRHIDGSNLVMPDIPPPYPEATYVCAAFTYFPGPLVTNPATFFQFTSSPTAWIGAGQTFNSANVTASRTFNLGAYTDSVHFSADGYEVTMVGPGLTLAQVGFYPAATRWPFMGSGPGLNFTAPGRGNNTLTGWFHVLQADYQTNGQPAAFAVDFVQYDEGNVTRWNRGSVRYNSTIPAPGTPPPLSLSKFIRTNGVVSFTLAGPADSAGVIQTSSNLVIWLPLVTNTISPVGLAQITDPGAAGAARRFYRAAATAGGGGGGGSNDQFANRITVPSGGGVMIGSNSSATKEAGESNHGGSTGGKSVWWTWTAPASGLASISLDGSSFDTLLGIYQGSAVNGLTPVAQDDDGGAGATSRVIFTAAAGTTYQIAVDGFAGASGQIKLTVNPGLLNDNFVDRLDLVGTFDQVIGSNVGAYWEPFEPYHWDSTGEKSVWWKWQAPGSGTVTISTAGSTFDTILAVYTGPSVSALTLIANNDDHNAGITSQVSFFATAGTVYQIAVDGYGTASGSINLLLSQ
jgi:hypothetical protein